MQKAAKGLPTGPSAQLAASQGGEYTPNAEYRESGKGHFDTFYEKRMRSGMDRDGTQKQGENQSCNSHAEHLADDPHGRSGSRGDPVERPFDRRHDRIGVGGREKGYTEAEEKKADDNIGQACFLFQEDQQEKASGNEGHTDGREGLGFNAVGKTPGKGREDRLRYRLKDKNGTGMQRGVALYVLEKQAQKETYREGSAEVDQGRQVGEGKDPVSSEETDIEERAFSPEFPQDEGKDSADPQGDKKAGGDPGQERETQHDRYEGQAVDEGSHPVKTIPSGPGPLLFQHRRDYDQEENPQRHDGEKDGSPAQVLG